MARRSLPRSMTYKDGACRDGGIRRNGEHGSIPNHLSTEEILARHQERRRRGSADHEGRHRRGHMLRLDRQPDQTAGRRQIYDPVHPQEERIEMVGAEPEAGQSNSWRRRMDVSGEFPYCRRISGSVPLTKAGKRNGRLTISGTREPKLRNIPRHAFIRTCHRGRGRSSTAGSFRPNVPRRDERGS